MTFAIWIVVSGRAAEPEPVPVLTCMTTGPLPIWGQEALPERLRQPERRLRRQPPASPSAPASTPATLLLPA